MTNGPDDADGAPFTPLERFVMELFRTITPNPGSSSAAVRRRQVLSAETGLIQTPHRPTSMDPALDQPRGVRSGPLQDGADERRQ